VKKLDRPTSKLAADNRSRIDAHVKTFGKDQTYTPLLQLLADVLDASAAGADWYCTIGCNRDRSALLLTVHQDGVKGYLSGLSLAELATACESVL